jgi:hypothetical protein
MLIFFKIRYSNDDDVASSDVTPSFMNIDGTVRFADIHTVIAGFVSVEKLDGRRGIRINKISYCTIIRLHL